jgi:hypothetical protein
MEEAVDELRVGDLCGIVGDPHRLQVALVIIVGRIGPRAAGVADHHVLHARDALQGMLDGPEAAAGEDGGAGGGRGGAEADQRHAGDQDG